MKFKALEVYLAYGDHNSSIRAIEEKADLLVNDWLGLHPKARIEHFAQSLVDVNKTIVYQIGIFYTEQ